MILKVLCVVVVVEWGGPLVGDPCAAAYVDYEDDDDDADAAAKFYDKYRAEDLVTQPLWSTEGPAARVRRYENTSDVQKELSQEELQDVRGALNQILSGHNIESLLKPKKVLRDDKKNPRPTREEETTNTIYLATLYRTKKNLNSEDLDKLFRMREAYPTTPMSADADVVKGLRSAEEEYAIKILTPTRSSKPVTARYTAYENENTIVYSQYAVRTGQEPVDPNMVGNNGNALRQQKGNANVQPKGNANVAATTAVPSTCSKIKSSYLDVVALLNIISNLTYDYETNLTNWVNETLWQWSIPTCPTPTPTTTTTEITTTTFSYDYEGNGTGTVMAKCYVCGLEQEEIPRRAHCADAFAGDFLPLVPVDPSARGQIGLFRKYCRYMDVPNYHYNVSDPRSLWGRWTGGCAVRWIDLSGVYTQRTCRNRFKAVLGRHFVSKRMAKLEMALMWVDNGCIISPAASLVPLSRGISLFARFHACVCTGTWCNGAPRAPGPPPAPVQAALLALALVALNAR